MTTSVISTRLDVTTYDFLVKLKKELKITNKDIIMVGIRTIVQNKTLKKKFKDDFDDFILNKTYREDTAKLKNKYFRLHLVKNTLRRIIDNAYTSFILLGYIDMPPILSMIDDAFKIYDKFPDKEKILLKKKIDSLNSFKDEKFLFSFLKAEARKKGENLLVFQDVKRKLDSKRPVRK